MRELKDGVRSLVRISYDGRVHKQFRGTDADKRFANEVKVLRYLEDRGCEFVPHVIDTKDDELILVTTNCGQPVERLSEEKTKALFDELEQDYGVRHDDPFLRNITYSPHLARFCVIDFELAEILDEAAGGGEGGDRTVGAGDPDALPLHIQWSGQSRSGRMKPKNEDSLLAFTAETGGAVPVSMDGSHDLHGEGIVFAVSDGLGGHSAGALASRLVVRKLSKNLPARMGGLRENPQPLSVLTQAALDTHSDINRMAANRPDIDGMAATLVCAWFWERQMHFVHVGDSRLYRFRQGELKQLTHDHSRVGRMFRDGKINEREARTHPMRHVLQQVIGGQHQVVNPQVGSHRTEVGDWYLLCSDGVIDGLWNKNITQAFQKAAEEDRPAADVAEDLAQAAWSSAGRDDTTLFVLKIPDETQTG